MPTSIRLDHEIKRLLDQRARRDKKTRTDLIHKALAAWLKPTRPRLRTAICGALADTPDGFYIEGDQPVPADLRVENWIPQA